MVILINCILRILGLLYVPIILTTVLKRRFEKLPVWGYYILLGILNMPVRYLKYHYYKSIPVMLLTFFGAYLYYVLLVNACFRKEGIKNHLITVLVYLGPIFADHTLFVTGVEEKYILDCGYMGTLQTMIALSCSIFLTISYTSLFLYPVLSYLKQLLIPLSMMLAYTFAPIGQTIVVLYSYQLMSETIGPIQVGLLGSGILLAILADLTELHMMIEQNEKEHLRLKMQEIDHVKKMEQLQYEQLEQQRGGLEKIRHDLNNQIAVISALISQGEQEKAQEMIAQMQGQNAFEDAE